MTPTLEMGSDQEFIELLEQARRGDPNALGQLLDRCVPYLTKIAHDEADQSLKAKVGDSDFVQFACLDAVRGFKNFRGHTSKEMLGWLRQILIHRVHGAREEFHTDKRDIAAEISLQFDSDDDKNKNLHAPTSSPSELVVHQEEQEVIERALKEMAKEDREIIDMRQKEGLAFAEIARHLRVTDEAARKRWVRAVQTLQEKVLRLYGLSSE